MQKRFNAGLNSSVHALAVVDRADPADFADRAVAADPPLEASVEAAPAVVPVVVPAVVPAVDVRQVVVVDNATASRKFGKKQR